MDNESKELLKQISTKLYKTEPVPFIVTYKSNYESINDTHKFKFNFSPSLNFESDDHELALVNLETYFNIPNITEGVNNVFSYRPTPLAAWRTITFDTGTYDVTDISDFFSSKQNANGNGKITIKLFEGSSKSYIKLSSNNYSIDFTAPNNFANILGFTQRVVSVVYAYSDNVEYLTDISSLSVNVDCIQNTYINRAITPTIYSFYANVAPSFKIVQTPSNLVYLPINRRIIDYINVWITDQNTNLVNFRGDDVTIRFNLRKLLSIHNI